MRKYIDIINESQQADLEELEEGWKTAMGAAALGAAALTGLGNTSASPSPAAASDQLATMQQALPTFSDDAEEVAKQQGFDSAEAMYYFMKQRNKGATIEVDAFDRAVSDAKKASFAHPGNLLQYVADKIDSATKKD